jgi:hypothetical protein
MSLEWVKGVRCGSKNSLPSLDVRRLVEPRRATSAVLLRLRKSILHSILSVGQPRYRMLNKRQRVQVLIAYQVVEVDQSHAQD